MNYRNLMLCLNSMFVLAFADRHLNLRETAAKENSQIWSKSLVYVT